MALFCALSITVPREPVISPVSGFIFEKKLVEDFVSMYGIDPVSARPLKVEQLVRVKNGKRSTRIDRWVTNDRDKLRQLKYEVARIENDLEDAQQQLKEAKLRKFASLNVVSKLDKEIEEFDKYGKNNNIYDAVLEKNFSPVKGTPSTNITKIHDDFLATQSFTNHRRDSKTLCQEKKLPETPSKSNIRHHFFPTKSFVNLHQAENSRILCLDAHKKNLKTASGGEDSRICVIDAENDEIVSVLTGHENAITKMAFHPSDDLLLSGSSDCTLRIWDVEATIEMMIIMIHEGLITGLSFHPKGDLFLSSSLDRHWIITDIRRNKEVSKHEAQEKLTTAEFCPDGTMFAIGTANSQIELWDSRQQRKITNLSGHSGSVNSTSFDFKNFHLATSAEDSCVRLWDLRSNSIFHTIEYSDDYNIKDTRFDESGKYFSVVGNDVKLYSCGKWEECEVFGEHEAQITSVRFGHDSTFFITSGEDGTVKVYEKLG